MARRHTEEAVEAPAEDRADLAAAQGAIQEMAESGETPALFEDAKKRIVRDLSLPEAFRKIHNIIKRTRSEDVPKLLAAVAAVAEMR